MGSASSLQNDGALVSTSSYTVLRCEAQEDAVYLWSILRSHEIRADLMSDSTGTSRYDTDWAQASQVRIPWVDKQKRTAIARHFLESWELERQARSLQKSALDLIGGLGVESPESVRRFRLYQPPK